MATLAKTPSGQWKAVIRREGWPAVAKSFRTKRDAEDWSRAAEDEMVRGVFVNRATSHRQSARVALDRYLAEVTPTKRASTAYRERSRIKTLKEHLGRFSLASLTPDVISQYRDQRLEAGKSASSVRLELALLSNLFTMALREWRIGLTHNPVSLVRKPTPRRRERRLNAGEEAKLLAASDKQANPMFGWIVRLALHSGMRLGEIATLRVSQVDLERRVIRLTETKNGSARTVPLTKQATAVLAAALAHPLRPVAHTDFVFFGEPGKSGRRGSYRFEKGWNLLIKKLKLADFRFHDLRHEAVSRLVEAGLSDQEVSAISGHKSMQMLKRYTHLRAEDLVDKLDQLPEPKTTTAQ